MIKTISETSGRVGDKGGKKTKKRLEKSIEAALQSSVVLMKDLMNSSDAKKIHLCLDLRRKLEEVEKEFSVTLI